MEELDAMRPQAFATLPKAKIEVVCVPEFIQDGASNGYYNVAALDGSRPAYYYINLKDTHDWPKYTLPSLTYHEASPGHHLQISLAMESPATPMLLKRSEEHTSELQSLMRISYAVFCLNKNKYN